MRKQLTMLYELHQTDAQIHDLELQLAEAPKEASATRASLDKLQKKLEQTIKRQDFNEMERRKAESALAGEKEKVHKWEARLNDIRNSREFAALQRETEGLKRQNRDSEETILNLMAEGEALTKEINEMSEESSALSEKLAEQDSAAKKLMDELHKQIDALHASQQKVRQEVSPAALRKYERVLKGRDGIAMVTVHEGTCGGCHITLPPQLFIQLQRSDDIEICPNCQRILFWDGLLEKSDEADKDQEAPAAQA